ncbi:MAG: hypothetical protein MJ157_01495 [Clostridia bacterium]|nr:hypothetical protein [Clostridia bacterium]
MSQQEQTVGIPTFNYFLKGLPWVIAILVFSVLSYIVYPPMFRAIFGCFMSDPAAISREAAYAALAMGPQVALQITLFALANNWPCQNIENRWARGIALTVLSIVIQIIFWTLVPWFGVNLETWAFPIIATSWFFIALTSFVGGDAHMPDTPPVRRMIINVLIMTAGTVMVLNTIKWIPPFWFGLLEITLVTGGASYYFRRLKQPMFSGATWAFLFFFMWVLLHICNYIYTAQTGDAAFQSFGDTNANADWLWDVNGFGGWGVAGYGGIFGGWFALTGGFNFSVMTLIHCWPFCLIRQPWGTPVAIVVWFFILYWVAKLLMAITMGLPSSDPASDVQGYDYMWFNGQVLAWQTVAWGWAWVYSFGQGLDPYLWKGQKTPGTWDDVD